MAKRSVLSILKDMSGIQAVGRKRDGTGDYILRRSYFYTHGMTSEKLAASVEAQFEVLGLGGTVTAHGNHWAPFRGGSTVAQGSHFWVRVHIHGTALEHKPV